MCFFGGVEVGFLVLDGFLVVIYDVDVGIVKFVVVCIYGYLGRYCQGVRVCGVVVLVGVVEYGRVVELELGLLG